MFSLCKKTSIIVIFNSSLNCILNVKTYLVKLMLYLYLSPFRVFSCLQKLGT